MSVEGKNWERKKDLMEKMKQSKSKGRESLSQSVITVCVSLSDDALFSFTLFHVQFSPKGRQNAQTEWEFNSASVLRLSKRLLVLVLEFVKLFPSPL